MPVDLRSDTVTQPTPEMRDAIANAEVGDDMMSEDPAVNALQEKIAGMLGKEAALFVPSGVMSNQIAIRLHCQPADELLIEENSHIVKYEAGAPAALSGITCRTLRGNRGMLDVPDLEGQIHPDDQHCTQTRLLCLENTTNIGGGRVWPADQLHRVTAWATQNGLALHLDGARLFNAAVAGELNAKEIAAPFDTVSVCFSKGLGAPVGSALVGSAELISRAHRHRKLFGGAMRQSGFLAAAAIHALDHHVERLAEDHRRAKLLAEHIATLPHLRVDRDAVETNLIFFEAEPDWGTGEDLVNLLEAEGVRMLSLSRQGVRACTHLNLTDCDIAECMTALSGTIEKQQFTSRFAKSPNG